MFDQMIEDWRVSGQLHGELPPVPEESGVSFWVLALQVFGAWLAAIFMLLFLGLGAAPFIEGASSWVVLGLFATALSGFVLHHVAGVVARQFLLVASLAGQGALFIGADMFGTNDATAFFLIAAYEAVLLFWVVWLPHRLIVTLLGSSALVLAVGHAFSLTLAPYVFCFYWLVVCVLWVSEMRWKVGRYGEMLYALASGLSLSCAAFSLGGLFARGFSLWDKGGQNFSLATSAVSILFVIYLCRPFFHSLRMLAATLLIVAALAACWQAPAIGLGGLLLVFGFACGYRWLMWLGGSLLMIAVAHYYYDLQLDLLRKSGLMVLGGVLLLIVRHLVLAQEVQK